MKFEVDTLISAFQKDFDFDASMSVLKENMDIDSLKDFYLDELFRYNDFEGKTDRLKYWMYSFVFITISIFLSIIVSMIGFIGIHLSVLLLLFNLVHLVPNIAISVRRLHDVGLSGWFLLISFIPIVGFIVVFMLFCLRSESSKAKPSTGAKRQNKQIPAKNKK